MYRAIVVGLAPAGFVFGVVQWLVLGGGSL